MAKKGSIGVRLVRGPFVRLDPHPDHCSSADELREFVKRLRSEDPGALLAADLFAGGGGLSLGLQESGYAVVLSSDHFAEAVETHSHHFPGLSVDWDLSDPDRIEELAELIAELRIDLVAGGPPCQPFSKAGRSGIRYRVQQGLRDPHDERRDLWRAFLEVVKIARPRAVLMENVPDMALDREMFILRTMVAELEQIGYAVEERVADTWRWGVPQHRQRLILVALRDGIDFEWPETSSTRTTVWNAIGDLPQIEGGFRPEGGADGYVPYDGPVSSYQKQMRERVDARHADRVYDHITRPVRDDDAKAFAMMDAKTKYSDLAPELRRYRDDIFDDKYKRLDENDLSRTITAHIAKDGYWYIHPRQDRTLSVREAARLQSFPDWYRFAGPPSAAFTQIGNAVPPLLGAAMGSAIKSAMERSERRDWSTRSLSSDLANWYNGMSEKELQRPWLRSGSAWSVLLGETLLERADAIQVRSVWPALRDLSDPVRIRNSRALLETVGRVLDKVTKLSLVLRLAEAAPRVDSDSWLMRSSDVPPARRDLMMLVCGLEDGELDAEPVLTTRGVLRPVARFWGSSVDQKNTRTDGRLAVARLIGGGGHARLAHLALVEVAQSICRPEDPVCSECPLRQHCVEAGKRRGLAKQQLF
ncbi:DNA cytosine methyltransferase [Tessaracoccus oleiagri]|uniref:Cytosine-specific methyltransferase n=1 Tax=Tessaracoccus oleiagri TaxID=686624 RepID=A0A1G9I052_9ACTN|nr:DNA cytosine methyltransferase [Tessaracoccus oleiagri]SDL18426.1 DNA (cytosine-5)-methyltransferase 1 [Tessaracoccus oleiagri]